MMMETAFDPYDILFGDGGKSPASEALLFGNEVMLGDFNTDSASISPISTTIEDTEILTEFDPTIFEKLLNELFSTDPTTLKEESMNLPFSSIESEPTTREIGTDPMEPIQPTLPIIIKPANTNQLTTTTPIFLIQKINKPQTIESVPLTTTTTTTTPVPNEYYNLETDSSSLAINDYQMEENLPLTPSTSSESPDETSSNSPDSFQDNAYSKLLTNLDNLPTTGSLRLTTEEIKLIKQEGYPVPTKLPLTKAEEKMLKKIRRKIKNKISAQESRRKKKEYVDALEKKLTRYVNENTVLKERMAAIEKNQKSLAQERDLLRSMINKATPAPSTALMVFAVFFAVLFGVWSPLTTKTSIDDRSLALENTLIPSNNYQSSLIARKSLYEQQDSAHTNYVTNNYKSRVLLSVDEYDNHQHHGPYLPSNNKYKSTFQQQTAAPGYTYSNTVEKYMNKKIQETNKNLKRSLIDESSSDTLIQELTYKKLRSNYHVNENIVVIEATDDELENGLNESKSVKIIRVERTVPAIGNDTLKLAHRTLNE